MSGNELSARYNERSRTSHAPFLRARVEPSSDGIRVVGYVQWTVLIGARVLFAFAVPIFLVVAVAWWHVGEYVAAGLPIGGVLLFGGLSALEIWAGEASRDFEEERLRKELLDRLGRDPE